MNPNKISTPSNYDGYGANEKGKDLGRDDIDSKYYEESNTDHMLEEQPGQNVAAVADDLAFEKHLAKLHAEKIGKKSLEASTPTPTTEDLKKKPETTRTTFIDSRGVVHTSLEDLREAEEGYK